MITETCEINYLGKRYHLNWRFGCPYVNVREGANDFFFIKCNIDKIGLHYLFMPTKAFSGDWPESDDYEGNRRMMYGLQKIVNNKLYKSHFLRTFIQKCCY